MNQQTITIKQNYCNNPIKCLWFLGGEFTVCYQYNIPTIFLLGITECLYVLTFKEMYGMALIFLYYFTGLDVSAT